jgi:outer membrane usher protein FimD/PapC
MLNRVPNEQRLSTYTLVCWSLLLLIGLSLPSFAIPLLAKTNTSKGLQLLPAYLQPTKNLSITKPLIYILQPTFEISTPEGPPPGFEFLDEPQTTIMDVYYGAELVQQAEVTYTPITVRFSNPTLVVASITDAADKQAIIAALSGDIATHSAQLCTTRNPSPCGVIQPEVAGVIFDPGKLRLNVFINPRFLKSAIQQPKYLPASEAGLSYVHNFNLSTAGSETQQYYSLYNNAILAYRQAQLAMQYSYGNTLGSVNQQQLNIDQLAAKYIFHNYVLQGGILLTQSDSFIANQNILGFGISTSRELLINREEFQASPINISLALPSQVTVYRNNRVLNSQFFQAGNQQLDTSYFPQGAYDIVIEKRDILGNVTRQTQFFVKTTQLPPLHQTDYYFNLGFLQSNTSNGQSNFPSYSSIPIINAGAIKRLAEQWGVGASLTSGRHQTYFSSSVVYTGKGLQITPAALISTVADYGAGVTIAYSKERLAGSMTARKIWARDDRPQIQQQAQLDYFDPLTQNTAQYSANISYLWGSTTVNLTSNINQTAGAARQTQYGLSLSRPLKLLANSNGNLSFNLIKSDSETSGLVQYTFNFTQGDFNHNLAIGYSQQASAGQSNSGLNAQLNSNWSHQLTDNQLLQLGGGLNQQPASRNLNLAMNYQTARMSLAAAANQSQANGGESQQNYNLNLNTSLVIAPHLLSLNRPGGNNAAILVDVTGPKTGDKIKVMVNRQAIATVDTNRPQALFLEPYEIYQVTINPIGEQLYTFDHKERKVTLYPGNVQTLRWQLMPKIILFGQVLYPDGQPVNNAAVFGGIELEQTDEQGYLQVEIHHAQELAVYPRQGQTCLVKLPKLTVQNGLASIDKLTCVPEANMPPLSEKLQ